MSLWVSPPPITRRVAFGSSVIMVVPPVLLKVEAASNSREGGQDREWAWLHRALFGHTFARPVACHNGIEFIGPTGQFMDTRRVWPIWESDPMNTTPHTHYQRSARIHIIPAHLLARKTSADRLLRERLPGEQRYHYGRETQDGE